MEVVGGIYSLQPLPSHWLTLLSMDAPDSHCPLSGGATLARPLEPLSCSCTGQSGATPDMSGDL
jgi:hypothetical protein